MAKVKDIIGKKFNKLLAVRLISTRAGFSQKTKHEFLCDCGNRKVLETNSVKLGKTKSCGCLKKEKRLTGESRINEIISSYKAAAKKRKINWDLEKNDVKNIIFLNCYYCKAVPNNECRDEGNPVCIIKYNGIDRINSDYGYSKENCVPCCFKCNRAKSDMKQNEFYEWIKSIHYNLFNNINNL